MYHTTLWDPYEELKLEVSSEHNMTFEKTYIILRLWAIHIIINFNQDFSSRFLSCQNNVWRQNRCHKQEKIVKSIKLATQKVSSYL